MNKRILGTLMLVLISALAVGACGGSTGAGRPPLKAMANTPARSS
ncbi:MAG TPA: hypothetical protein VJ793_00670 [Anaerolineae bacterium]|nr:hypothetical protein [Anaerolineae bacterium]